LFLLGHKILMVCFKLFNIFKDSFLNFISVRGRCVKRYHKKLFWLLMACRFENPYSVISSNWQFFP